MTDKPTRGNVGVIAEYTIGYNFSGMYLQLQKVLEGVNKLGFHATLYDMWHSREQNYDLIHIYGKNYSLLQFAEIITKFGIPYVVSPNTWPADRACLRKYLTYLDFGNGVIASRQALERKLLMGAARVIANSDGELAQLAYLYRLPPDKLTVIPNGVEKEFALGDPALFRDRFGLREPFVLTVSEVFNETKNHLNLLKAWDHDLPKLVFVGNPLTGAYAEKCRALADKLGNVVVVGALPHDSELLKSAYKACAAFVLPSYAETTGLTALEAGISGAPIAITENGGTKAYFQELAFYCNPHSTESIRRAVVDALAAGRSTARADRFKAMYDWDVVSNMVADVYRTVLSQ